MDDSLSIIEEEMEQLEVSTGEMSDMWDVNAEIVTIMMRVMLWKMQIVKLMMVITIPASQRRELVLILGGGGGNGGGRGVTWPRDGDTQQRSILAKTHDCTNYTEE